MNLKGSFKLVSASIVIISGLLVTGISSFAMSNNPTGNNSSVTNATSNNYIKADIHRIMSAFCFEKKYKPID